MGITPPVVISCRPGKVQWRLVQTSIGHLILVSIVILIKNRVIPLTTSIEVDSDHISIIIDIQNCRALSVDSDVRIIAITVEACVGLLGAVDADIPGPVRGSSGVNIAAVLCNARDYRTDVARARNCLCEVILLVRISDSDRIT